MGCRASFQFFIAQDASFLAAFARAYSLAAQKAEQQHSPSVAAAIRSLMQGVQEELALHASYTAVRLRHDGVQLNFEVLLLLSVLLFDDTFLEKQSQAEGTQACSSVLWWFVLMAVGVMPSLIRSDRC